MRTSITSSIRPFTLIGFVLLASACAPREEGGVNREQQTRAPAPAAVPAHPRTETQARPDSAEERLAMSPGHPANASGAARKQQLRRAEAAYSAADLAAPVTGLAALPTPRPPVVDRENYLHYQDKGVIPVLEQPVSTFSVDVDTAAYANIRRMLAREGRLPPADAVRLEEMLNYFSYQYPAPDSLEQPFSISTELAPAPWGDERHLLQIGLKGFEPPQEQRPPANLVFLVDVSGSMQSTDKLGLVKKSLRLLVNRMTERDRIALAVYAGAARVVLESTPGDHKASIMSAIDALQAGGSTHGSAGIDLAYQLAEQNRIEGGINRVLIASDGDLNVGTVNIEALKDLVERKRKNGIALTTLGFGSGNYNYALMEQLADVGNGNASYIDSLQEAQKVLVNEMQSTLLTIASDVKIQVEFNPYLVREYRLIGYENRLLAREDFSNDKVDAGDIGAGHTVTALYEIVLADSAEQRLPSLRYQDSRAAAPDRGVNKQELAYIKLRYKRPGQADSIELARAVKRSDALPSMAQGSDDLRFAASVAGFGQILRGGIHTGNWGYADALELARQARGPDRQGYRSEFVHLVELARSLAGGS